MLWLAAAATRQNNKVSSHRCLWSSWTPVRGRSPRLQQHEGPGPGAAGPGAGRSSCSPVPVHQVRGPVGPPAPRSRCSRMVKLHGDYGRRGDVTPQVSRWLAARDCSRSPGWTELNRTQPNSTESKLQVFKSGSLPIIFNKESAGNTSNEK